MTKEPTQEQQMIIDYSRNTVVTAKPGSGKTYTVVEKIFKVLTSLPDYKGVIAISFTNKASDELKKRCNQKGISAKQSFFGTIDHLQKDNLLPEAYAIVPTTFHTIFIMVITVILSLWLIIRFYKKWTR